MSKKIGPRTVPDRDDFYMGLAFWMASKSKDPTTQCGSVIITHRNEPLGWGYNGPPSNIDDEEIDWSRPEKYNWVDHAEDNAIWHSCGNTEGATIYVTGHPCKSCMLKIVRAKIGRVIWFRQKTDSQSTINPDPKAIEIAEQGGVELQEFKGNLNWMRDRIQWMREIGIFTIEE